MVNRLRRMSCLVLFWALSASAQDSDRFQRAFSELAPELRHLSFLWAVTTGDLNGDGIDDVAMVMTGSRRDDADREERLVVLAGQPDGNYRILSISGEFCHPAKFYNLDIKRNSLFVQAVEYADAARVSSYTLQFRYDARLRDFALIGNETVSEGYEDGTLDRLSTNRLTGETLHTIRQKGKTRSVKGRIALAAKQVLGGTACDVFQD